MTAGGCRIAPLVAFAQAQIVIWPDEAEPNPVLEVSSVHHLSNVLDDEDDDDDDAV